MGNDLLSAYDQAAAEAAKPVFGVKFRDDASLEAAPQSLIDLARANGFDGKAGAVLAGEDGVLVGLGDGGDPFVYAAASTALPAGDYMLADDGLAVNKDLTALGWLLGAYRFTRYKKASPAQARLIAGDDVDVEGAHRAFEAIALVRDLVNTPAADMSPQGLEDAARDVAEQFGASITVTVGDDLLTDNFPMIHAVGRAAAIAPRLIDIRWGDEAAPKLTLVGKGVCFDSGGLNIKGAGGMGLMKKDMGGAAHVLGLAHMIMAAGLNVRLRVLVPAVENAIAGDAFRPGDVLTSRKGLTVEIGNTDAEGRLVLADALDLGAEEEPDLMISLATLTGAARVAVGPELAPFYTDDDGLADAIAREGEAQADPVWRMPLWKNYAAMLSSKVADMNNISGGGFAGSITAALFLQKFATAKTWTHFDIYAWRPSAAPGREIGGEAQAIRALFAVIRERF